ncbi:unnamed protein product [Penicillium pancosmium]
MTTPPAVPVQLLVFAKRKEDLTKQEFDDYWRGPHAKKFLEFEIVKKHCIRYEQYHDDPTARADGETALGLPHSGWDGVASLTFDSAEGAKAVFGDPEFLDWATNDEPRFCAGPNIAQRMMLVGNPEVIYKA